jgi:hypothetical protein
MGDVCLCGFPPIEQRTPDGWETRNYIQWPETPVDELIQSFNFSAAVFTPKKETHCKIEGVRQQSQYPAALP